MKIPKAFALAAALLSLAPAISFAGAVLTVAPLSGPIIVGQLFTVAINVTGPTVIHGSSTITSNVSDLAAFQFDLAYNCTVPTANPASCQPGASLLSAVSLSEGGFLPEGGSNFTFFEPGVINNTLGEVTSIGDVGASGVTGKGDLVDVTFRALTPGVTSISILANSDLQFYDPNFNQIVVEDSSTTSPTTETFPTNQFLSAQVTIVSPEPGSGLLLLGALAALIPYARRSRS